LRIKEQETRLTLQEHDDDDDDDGIVAGRRRLWSKLPTMFQKGNRTVFLTLRVTKQTTQLQKDGWFFDDADSLCVSC